MRFANSGEPRVESGYWKALATADVPPLPVDYENGENLFGTCRSAQVCLSKAETKELIAGVHHAYHTEINDIMLTALGRALRRWHGADATLISLEGHGREPLDDEIDVSRTVGWFTTMFPFRLEVGGDEIGEQIQQVRDSLRRIPRKGIGYGILKYLAAEDLKNALRSQPSPQVGFNYLGEFSGGDSASIFTLINDAPGKTISPTLPRRTLLDLVGIILDEQLHLSLVYSTAQYEHHTIRSLLVGYQTELGLLIEHCKQQGAQEERDPAAELNFSASLSAEDYESILGELQ
jgi:fengycin family lipopeptide synthetase D/gramicidin S synthase 2/tyrocidine synthetase-2